MNYGEKIATLRKKNGMTQATLGAHLNVTYQAVSKWEREESSPDFATMSKIAKLFNVPLSYFEEEWEAAAAELNATPLETDATDLEMEDCVPTPAQPATVAEPTESAQEESAENPIPPAPIPESAPKRITELPPSVFDDLDFSKEEQASKQVRPKQLSSAIKERKHVRERDEKLIRKRNVGLIASAAITLVLLTLAIISLAKSQADAGLGTLACIILVVFSFSFFSQVFWNGFIVDVLSCGIKIIGTPGVIFTLDLDGLIFLIGIKLLFALLRLLVLFICLLFFLFIAIVVSPFALVPQCIKLTRGKEL